MNDGRWTDLENELYVKFLMDNRLHFEEPGNRKRNQIFMKMSLILGTRTPSQCRSHHQKVEIYAQTRTVNGLCDYILENKMTKNSPSVDSLKARFKSHVSILKESFGHTKNAIEQNFILTPNNKYNLFNIVLLDV